MIWPLAGALLLIAVFAADWRRPLPKTVLIVLGAAFVATGFLRLAYVQWDLISASAKPLDVPLSPDGVRRPFVVARAGTYDVWLQTDRPSALFRLDCADPDAPVAKSCPVQRAAIRMSWTAGQGTQVVGAGRVAPDAGKAGAPSVAENVPARPAQSSANAEDRTPKYRFLGAFTAAAPGNYWIAVAPDAPNPFLAKRNPRLIVGLSSVETAPRGFAATLFCVLCVFGGGFMLLKALVPRKAAA